MTSAPPARSARTASARVAPVVTTSSITIDPQPAAGARASKLPRRSPAPPHGRDRADRPRRGECCRAAARCADPRGARPARPPGIRGAGTPRARWGSAPGRLDRAPGCRDAASTAARSAGASARASPVRPSSLSARTHAGRNALEREAAPHLRPRPLRGDRGFSRSRQVSHSGTSGSSHPAHATGSTRARASAKAARTVAPSHSVLSMVHGHQPPTTVR